MFSGVDEVRILKGNINMNMKDRAEYETRKEMLTGYPLFSTVI
jgi:hypothetical protein